MVERYEITGKATVKKSPTGYWVEYSDWELLEAENERLKELIENADRLIFDEYNRGAKYVTWYAKCVSNGVEL